MTLQNLLIDKNLSKSSSGIYLIYCSASQKGYIGRARNIASRWKTHKTRLRKGIHENPHLQRAWKKYGESVFVFLVIENSDYRIGHEREEYWIRQIEDPITLYNMRTVDGVIDFKMPREAVEKIRQANKKRKLTDKQKQHLREINLGKKQSEETKIKRSESNRKTWAKKEKGSKINKEEVMMIKQRLKTLSTCKELEDLARSFNISLTSIYDIKMGRTWRNVNG